MCFEVDVHTGSGAKCLAPLISPKIVMHVAPKPGKIELHTYRTNIASLTLSLSATYSASVVESVTHF